MRCAVDVRKDSFANVEFSGGATMFHRVGECISKKLVALAPLMVKII